MTPYELRYKIFETAIGLAEGQALHKKEIADSLISKDVDEDIVKRYVDYYPSYPSLEEITSIARDINKFVTDGH